MSKKTKSKLSSLSGDTSDHDAPISGGDHWLVFAGFADHDREYPHDGDRSVHAGEHGFIQFRPGLNLMGEAFAEAKSHPAVAALLGDVVHETDSNLTGYTSRAQLRELAERTTQPEALERLLELEQAKPLTSGPKRDRRDVAHCDKLLGKIAHYSRATSADFGNLAAVAAGRSMAATG